MDEVTPLGREDVLHGASRALERGDTVLISGPAGAGKSTVVAALAARAAAAGQPVLRCAPAESESQLPFLTLIDLLAGVAENRWQRLEAPWQQALRAVRTGAAAEGAAGTTGETVAGAEPDGARQLAIRLGVLHLLRLHAEDGPALLVLDDVQWMDPASAEVLAFAIRRLARNTLRVLATQRLEPGHNLPSHEDLCPPPVREFPLEPLPLHVLHDVVCHHTGAEFTHSTMRRIHAVTDGNPLFALEIARALRLASRLPDPEEPLPVPERLRALMWQRIRRLSGSARQTLLLASAAARPTLSLLRHAGRRAAASDLAAADRLGIIETSTLGVIRFSHPLLAATLYAEASQRQRRRVHSLLATAVTDPIERARHRALATSGPDGTIADELEQAATAARRRGAPGVAAELGRVAAARTPEDARALERLLAAAGDALAAGACDQARQAAEAVLAEASDRRQRVQAWLVVLDATGQALPHAEPLLGRALADAGDDPGLQAQVRLRTVAKDWVEGRLQQALADARRCCALATRAGDTTVLVRALCLRATCELALGLPGLRETIDRLLLLAPDPAGAPIYHGPHHLLARLQLLEDRPGPARAGLLRLLRLAEDNGQVEDMAGILFNLAELELRAGQCAEAMRAARRGLALVEDAGLSAGPALAAAALSEAAGGDPAQARLLAARGIRASEADGDQLFLFRNLHALGCAALAAGDAAAAVTPLRRAAHLETGMGALDPALFRWHADWAEALVAARHLDEAEEVVERAAASAAALGRGTVLACLERPRALRELALQRTAQAADRLRAAADQVRELPLEYGRTWYAVGVAERRRRRRSAARAAFGEALRTFQRAGATPWVARLRAEVSHTEPAPTASAATGSGLTSVEHRIAHLATTGATNHQIATVLSLSVKTVESYLTRVYRKLRVRSRAELATTLAGRHGGPSLTP